MNPIKSNKQIYIREIKDDSLKNIPNQIFIQKNENISHFKIIKKIIILNLLLIMGTVSIVISDIYKHEKSAQESVQKEQPILSHSIIVPIDSSLEGVPNNLR